MRRILCLLCLLVFATPAMAESATVTLPPPVARLLEASELSPGHALALGAGLFGGAMLGSVFIAGGAVAAVIGGAAGLAAGHWAWVRHGDKLE